MDDKPKNFWEHLKDFLTNVVEKRGMAPIIVGMGMYFIYDLTKLDMITGLYALIALGALPILFLVYKYADGEKKETQ